MAAETFRDCADCPVMVRIPAGAFYMGSYDAEINWALRIGAAEDGPVALAWLRTEQPKHRVVLRQFAMSVTEVTRRQYAAFQRHQQDFRNDGPCWLSGGLNPEAQNASPSTSESAQSASAAIPGKQRSSLPAPAIVESQRGSWRKAGIPQNDDHPVVCVDPDDASAYVRWLSERTGRKYRLPSEAEWEYAARAGTATARFWGWEDSDACKHANVADSSAVRALGLDPTKNFQCVDDSVFTAPVGRYVPNTFGLHDVLGNVAEWTADCYNASYASAPADGSARRTGDCNSNVFRGGSWKSQPWMVRSAFRGRGPYMPSRRLDWIGFRVVREE